MIALRGIEQYAAGKLSVLNIVLGTPARAFDQSDSPVGSRCRRDGAVETPLERDSTCWLPLRDPGYRRKEIDLHESLA